MCNKKKKEEEEKERKSFPEANVASKGLWVKFTKEFEIVPHTAGRITCFHLAVIIISHIVELWAGVN